MILAGINLELAELGTTETAMRHHTPNGIFNETFRIGFADFVCGGLTSAAAETGEVNVDFTLVFVSGKNRFGSVDNNYECPGIDVRGIGRFVLAPQRIGNADSQTADRHFRSVKKQALRLDFANFS